MEKLQRSFVVIAQFYYPDLTLFICCYKGLSSLTSRFCYKSLNVTVLLITKSLMTSNLYDHILSSLLEPPKRIQHGEILGDAPQALQQFCWGSFPNWVSLLIILLEVLRSNLGTGERNFSPLPPTSLFPQIALSWVTTETFPWGSS